MKSTKRTLDPHTIKDIRRFLNEKHAELSGSLRSLSTGREEGRTIYTPDNMDSATEATQDTIQAALINHLRPQVTQVEAALERLALGDYGFCRDCGSFIGVARLRALPFAQRCTPCQSLAERRTGRVLQPAGAAG